MSKETLFTIREVVTDAAWNSSKTDITEIVHANMRQSLADAILRAKGKWEHNEKAGVWKCEIRLHVMTDDELDAEVAKRLKAMSEFELMHRRFLP